MAIRLNRERWRSAFLIFCGIWAFWGCSKVKDFMFRNVEFLSNLERATREELPNLHLIQKVIFGVFFLFVYLIWTSLPLQISLLCTSYEISKNTSPRQRLMDSLLNSFGFVFSTSLFTIIWLIWTLFLAFIENFVLLAQILGILGICMYLLISKAILVRFRK